MREVAHDIPGEMTMANLCKQVTRSLDFILIARGSCKILRGGGREWILEKGQEVINILICLYYSWVDGLVCVLSSSEPGNSSVQVLGREQSIDPKRKHGASTGNQEHPGSGGLD